MPLHMRIPKLRGSRTRSARFRSTRASNLDQLESSGLTDVSPDSLHAAGIAHKGALVKILGAAS